MSIIISNFTDIDKLYELYDSSYCIIFSDKNEVDISLCNTDYIMIDMYDQLLPIKKTLWKKTNEACNLLEYYPYKICNSIWNIFFIDYMKNYNSIDDGIPLIMNGDISGIFGIYDKNNTKVENCKSRLFFSNKLKTFVLHDIYENEVDNNKYIIGQLMSHLSVDYPNMKIKDISGSMYKCPISWRKFAGNTYGICRNNEPTIIKKWSIVNNNSYYPIHILSELKVLYIWLIIMFKYLNVETVRKRGDYKKITYIFSDIEYNKLKKYAKNENIIEYILDGYLKFVGIKWSKKYLLYEINVDGKLQDIYPLVPNVNNYDIYKKSKWINNWVKKWNINKKIDKILININIDNNIDKSELQERKDILMQIDIGINKVGKLVNIIYLEETEEMLKWKRLLDNFLNIWVK
jgi:hypothetical protein